MNRKQKNKLWRIVISAVLLITAMMIPVDGWLGFVIYLIPYLAIGAPVLLKAGKNILRGQVFDENFLMTVATVGAMCIGEYKEAVAVMLFYQVGELFESYAVGKSRKSIAALMDIRPDVANVERNGQVISVDPEEVHVGEVIVVRPGERVSLDGQIVEGSSTLDTAALTGESMPREVLPQDQVLSGCINLTGVLRVRVEKEFGESTVSKILELVENASERKAQSEAFITRFARYYTPAVCLGALLLALLPPLILGGQWAKWIERALIFLVVSCPCALVISIPLSFFGGIGGASKCGILIKGSNYLEALANTHTVVFDKTGTLTEGSFQVSAIHPEGISSVDLLETAALAESYSSHPISRSLQDAYGKKPDRNRVTDVQEIAGHGVKAIVDGRQIAAGNARMMQSVGVTAKPCSCLGTTVHVAVEGTYTGHIVISDTVKKDARQTVDALRAQGVRKIVMLTGDSEAVGKTVGQQLGMDEAICGLLPADKVTHVERLMREMPKGGKLIFAGDGINDAPVLSRADIGVAMGAMGSDAAIEAADVVLMNDQPSGIATAIDIARRTLRIVRENIAFALGVKALVLVLGALGLANMWAAVFADVGVSVIAILNAMRMLKVDQNKDNVRADN